VETFSITVQNFITIHDGVIKIGALRPQSCARRRSPPATGDDQERNADSHLCRSLAECHFARRAGNCFCRIFPAAMRFRLWVVWTRNEFTRVQDYQAFYVVCIFIKIAFDQRDKFFFWRVAYLI